jgi:uncharacterized membrane protein YeaQ/YmgE (transglycosylase-associated protein family)
MGLIYWGLIGLAAGAIAKMATPQEEKGGWVSSIIVGIIGAIAGGFISGILGLHRIFGSGLIGDLIVATGGAILILFIYHKYLADKLNLPI